MVRLQIPVPDAIVRAAQGERKPLFTDAQRLFGFELGVFFSVAMVAFAGAAILYDTSNVLHHYPEDRAVGAALDAVFPLGADDVQLAVATLLRAAPTLAALEPGGFAAIGAALAHADNVSPGLAMGQVNDRMLGNELSDEAIIAIVAGFAGGGDAADQVIAALQRSTIRGLKPTVRRERYNR